MDFPEKLSYALATRERLRHFALSVVVRRSIVRLAARTTLRKAAIHRDYLDRRAVALF
jgi:hypothetical protein